MSSAQDVLALFSRGDKIFIPGSSAEPREMVEALSKTSNELPSLEITSTFLPGINTLSLAAPDNQINETTLFPRPAFADSKDRLRVLPMSYYSFQRYLASCKFNWSIVHLSPADEQGFCSLGVSTEFMPTVIKSSSKILGFINQQMPPIAGAPQLHLSELAEEIHVDSPLVTYDPGVSDDVSSAIADLLRSLIKPGSTLQTGLGKVPCQLLTSLTDLQDLRFHSGLLTDGFFELLDAGALDPEFQHITCSALGSQEFYNRLPTAPNLSIEGVDMTHAPATLSGCADFTAINSALEVDLFGQANLEMIGNRQVSSAGGAPDFARAAQQSINGMSVVALPATLRGGTQSRIVPRLDNGQVVSLTRGDIDYVVTEYGIASLSNQNIENRAQALISIAAPDHRDELTHRWNALHK